MMVRDDTDLSPEVIAARDQLASILFLDLVGYSLLPTDAQACYLRELTALVLDIPAVRGASASGRLIKLARGDGMALVFFLEPGMAVRAAVDLARTITRKPHLRIRMGVHDGLVRVDEDVNGFWDVAGDGIVMARRVMEPGDQGHILLSSSSARYATGPGMPAQGPRNLGECEIKHGGHIYIYNLVGTDFGNADLPAKIIRQRVGDQTVTRVRVSKRPTKNRKRLAFALVAFMFGVIGLVIASPPLRRLIPGVVPHTEAPTDPPELTVHATVPPGSSGVSKTKTTQSGYYPPTDEPGTVIPREPKVFVERSPVSHGPKVRVELINGKPQLVVAIPYDSKPDRIVRVEVDGQFLGEAHAVAGEELRWKMDHPAGTALITVDWVYGAVKSEESWQRAVSQSVEIPDVPNEENAPGKEAGAASGDPNPPEKPMPSTSPDGPDKERDAGKEGKD